MPRPDHTRQNLVATTAALLRRQGYAATGLAQVVAESGATTGSLYHHFPDGKEALAEAALDASAAEVTHLLEELLARPDETATLVARWLRRLGKALATDPRDGCPIAPTALESIHTSPLLRAAAGRAFASWGAVIAARLVRDGWSTVDAQRDATAVLCLVEGALMLDRTAGNREALDAASDAVARLLMRRP